MSSFRKVGDLYSAQITTGPQSVLLRLTLLDERVEDFEVSHLEGGSLKCNPTQEIVRARVLEGTDAANAEFGTSLHPRLAHYAVDAYNDECRIIGRAAYAIAERLARLGDGGYPGTS